MSDKPAAPPHRTNAVVDAEMRKRCLVEALEHAAKPWSLEAEPQEIRTIIQATVDAVEDKMLALTQGAKNLRPLPAVQALVQAAWLAGWHAGRTYEIAIAKAKREASRAAAKATKESSTVRRTQRAKESARQAENEAVGG